MPIESRCSRAELCGRSAGRSERSAFGSNESLVWIHAQRIDDTTGVSRVRSATVE